MYFVFVFIFWHSLYFRYICAMFYLFLLNKINQSKDNGVGINKSILAMRVATSESLCHAPAALLSVMSDGLTKYRDGSVFTYPLMAM